MFLLKSHLKKRDEATWQSVVESLSPVLWFDFTEASGNLDNKGSLGASGDMSPTGSPTYAQAGQLGAGEAVDLDGSNAKFSASNHTNIQISNKLAFSICALVNIDSDGENNLGTIFGKGYNFFNIQEVDAGVNAKIFFIVDHATSDANAQTGAELTLNQWHFVCVTYNEDGDNKGKIYVDGSEVTKTTDNAGVGALVDDSAMNFIIGDIRFNNRNFDGSMDEFLFFDKALTSAQVLSLHNTLGL